jgi:hypothetical protein
MIEKIIDFLREVLPVITASIIVTTVIILLVYGGSIYGNKQGIKTGAKYFAQKIISGECWLNQQTRDIECINYIGD